MKKSIKCDCGGRTAVTELEILPGLFSEGYKCQKCGDTEFTEEQMKKCYPVPEENGYKEINFELELKNAGNKIRSSDYYKNERFRREMQVLVKEGKNYKKDTLVIKTQTELFRRPE